MGEVNVGRGWVGVAGTGGALAGLAAVAWAGWVSLSLIDQVVLLGVAVVLPLSVGGRLFWWVAAAGGVLVSFLVPAGWAGLLVGPLALVTCAAVVVQAPAAVEAWRDRPPLPKRSRRRTSGGVISTGNGCDRPPPAERLQMRTSAGGLVWTADRVERLVATARLLACIYAVVAAGALAQSRFGVTFLDIHEPIVELTAVHFIFAGAASLMLAVVTLAQQSPSWRHGAVAAVLLTGAAPPVVATGFVTRSAIPQVGGAVLMTAGVWLTAVLHLRDAAATFRAHPIAGALLTVSGLTIWVPMVLAVAWAAAHYWDVPAMSVPDMARTHGLANALGFVLCGLVARRLAGPVLPSDLSQGIDGSGMPL